MTTLIIAFILVISIITDLRSRRILNIVTLPAILIAFLYHTLTTGFNGFLFSGQGFLVGLGLLFIPFIMGGIGAGDVKLLSTIGAWKGTMFVLYTGIYGAIIGGIISIFILLKKNQLRFTIKSILFSMMFLKGAKGTLQLTSESKKGVSIPYAIPIALGAIIAFLTETYV